MRCLICGADKAACKGTGDANFMITLPQKGDRMANKNDYVADRRLYLDKDGNVVEAKDPKKTTLLVAQGNTLPEEVARKHGLIKEEAESGRKSKAVASDADAISQIQSEEEAGDEIDAEDDGLESSTVGRLKKGRKK